MKKTKLFALLFAAALMLVIAFSVKTTVYAAEEGTAVTTEEAADSAVGTKALSAAIVVGLAAAAGAVAMGLAVAKTNEAIARQPEAAGQINSSMMLGLVFIETAIIYALIVAILIIFVL